mmetsp:Transcript_25305/g.31130  ORF Transcript_25305/g.31130 Transcript_25305/m.31130 type:complete len:133 (+) Transcript_25305:702-1100(+)
MVIASTTEPAERGADQYTARRIGGDAGRRESERVRVLDRGVDQSVAGVGGGHGDPAGVVAGDYGKGADGDCVGGDSKEYLAHEWESAHVVALLCRYARCSMGTRLHAFVTNSFFFMFIRICTLVSIRRQTKR